MGPSVPSDFDEFYAANFGALVVQLRAGTGDLAEAQDVVQEAFCRAWSRWADLVRYDDPVAWVRRVAWNLAFSGWRRRRTARNYLTRQRISTVDGPGPDRVALNAALARLPVNQRKAVVLHYLAGLSTHEIAYECGVPDATVRSWLHRARASLFRQLSDPTEEGSGGEVR